MPDIKKPDPFDLYGSERESQQKAAEIHQAVMESMVAPTIFIQNDLSILDVSRSLADLVAFPRANLLGRSVNCILEGDMQAYLCMQPSKLTSALPACGMTAITSGGGKVPVQVVALPIYIQQHRHWFIQVVDMAIERQSECLKSEFVANVSHELRTPLASIAGALGLISAGATGTLSPDTTEMVCIALHNTKRLIKLINDLLDIERVAEGKLHFAMGSHSFRAILNRATREIQPFALGRLIHFQIEDCGGEDTICVDEDRLLQVLTNVLSNAVKFSPEGSMVKILLKPDDVYHRVDIIDQGSGIPISFRPRVFDKFTQADNLPNRRASGTGLGLAISREIVGRLDGKIWFSDNPDGGTIFTIEIPASRPRD